MKCKTTVFAAFLKDIRHEVEVETLTELQTLTGEGLTSSANSYDEAHLDISEAVFWQRGQCAFFNVTVFNPFTKSHLNQNLT